MRSASIKMGPKTVGGHMVVDVRTYVVMSIGVPNHVAMVGVFSPDGKTIAFVGQVGLLDKIFIITPDGDNDHGLPGLCATDANCSRPAWSPDGESLLFHAWLTAVSVSGGGPSWAT